MAEVATRVGVSTHSLYKWGKAVSPGKTEQQAGELLKARSGVLRLRTQLHRIEDERNILKKGRAVPCQKVRVQYCFINDHRQEFRAAMMCRVLRVSRGGFYQWVHKLLSDRLLEDQQLLGLICHSYNASSGVYGYRRVLGDLCEVGELVQQVPSRQDHACA